jgi:DNA-binding NarL/FixJ family response regulator
MGIVGAERQSAAPRARALPQLRTCVFAEDDIRCRRISSTLARGGLTVVAEGWPPSGIVPQGAEGVLDAVVLAWEAIERRELETVDMVRETLGGLRLVAVAAQASRRAIADVLERGADGLVLESEVESCLALAVRAACSGQIVVPRMLGGRFERPVLTAREKQVLGMVVMGFSNGEIARKLHLAESTVKSHLSSIFSKLGVRSRNEAAALVLDPEQGLGVGILAIAGPENEEVA